MSTTTENAILDARHRVIRSAISEFDDVLHLHFEEIDNWHWPEVADEGLRIWNKLFNEELSSDSTVALLLNAVACQAAMGVTAALAHAIGLDRIPLFGTIALWTENQFECPEKVGWTEFMNNYAQMSGTVHPKGGDK